MSTYSYWSKREGFVLAIQDFVAYHGRGQYKDWLGYLHNTRFFIDIFDDDEYAIVMEKTKDPPFCSVVIHVEDANRCALPLSSCCSEFSSTHVVIWRYSETEISKYVPNFKNDHSQLFFLITANSEKDMKDIFKMRRCSMMRAEWTKTTASCRKSLRNDVAKLFEKDTGEMVQLICGDRAIKVHSFILRARSTVFAAMLRSDMVEAHTGTVKIEGEDPEIFDLFVRYLYTAELPEISVETAKCLYKFADMYAVDSLANRCSLVLRRTLVLFPSYEILYEMLLLADAHNDRRFKECIIGYMLYRECTKSLHSEWEWLLKKHPKLAREVWSRAYND